MELSSAKKEHKEFQTSLSDKLAIIPNIFGIRTEERPDFMVLYRRDDKELRDYKPYVIARTTVQGLPHKKATQIAFLRLANYIFGKNTGEKKMQMGAPVLQQPLDPVGAKMEMTAPVFQSETEKGIQMSFVIPTKYSLQNVPRPLDGLIELTEMPERTVAVLKYTGLNTDKRIKEKTEELRQWILGSGHYEITSEAQSAEYDPPTTIPFLRKNEIHSAIRAKN